MFVWVFLQAKLEGQNFPSFLESHLWNFKRKYRNTMSILVFHIYLLNNNKSDLQPSACDIYHQPTSIMGKCGKFYQWIHPTICFSDDVSSFLHQDIEFNVIFQTMVHAMGFCLSPYCEYSWELNNQIPYFLSLILRQV